MINVGPWYVFPELRFAENSHNGTYAELDPCGDNDWKLTCINCPAQWMFQQLAEWWSQNLPTDRKTILYEERYPINFGKYVIRRRGV